MTSTKLVLLALGVIGSAAAVIGILWSGRPSVLEDTDGTPYFSPQRGWDKARGPLLGITGVAMSFAATVTGLFMLP
ncbi:hypothetical protein ACTAQI_08910 [Pseudarthrobacter sp. alpha12b]